MREKNKTRKISRESGVALFFALFALLLLSATAASLVLMTNRQTAVNANYRKERTADYAAKAGFEEVRARMRILDPASINALLPTAPPPPGGVLYVLNEGNAPGTVQPWVVSTNNNPNAYMDDELCHDGYPYNGNMQQQQQGNLASDLRCSKVPPGNGWYNTVSSNAPCGGTSAGLPYKWVRLAMKLNCTVQGAQNATAYCVNAGQPATTQVCWNGATEVLLSGALTCQAMGPTVACPTCGSTNPVYVITSLAVSGSSTRKMVQAEVALDPAQPFPYGLYATGTSCLPPALSLNGGGNSNPFTDSFNSATPGVPSTPTGGDVGSNGGVLLDGHAQVGGQVGVLSSAPSPPGPASPCIGPTGDYSVLGLNAGLYNPAVYPQNTLTQIPAPVVFPPPPDPVPAPPSTAYSGSSTLVPGTYGAITLTGDLTLSPGTYNIYSLNMSGNANIIVNPAGALALKFPSARPTPL